MSVHAIAWALNVTTGKATAKCVLVALANYADEDGVCWPGQALIARQTEMSVDSVQRRLRDLEAEGLIVRERRNGRGGARTSDRYRLQMRSKLQSAVLDHGSGKKSSQNRRANGPKPQLCGLDIDEPSIEPSIKQSRNEQEEKKGLASRQRRRSYLKNQESNQRNQGRFEAEIAQRLGPNGWDILFDLPRTEVDHLCIRQRRATLDEETLAKLRSAAPP